MMRAAARRLRGSLALAVVPDRLLLGAFGFDTNQPPRRPGLKGRELLVRRTLDRCYAGAVPSFRHSCLVPFEFGFGVASAYDSRLRARFGCREPGSGAPATSALSRARSAGSRRIRWV